MLRSRLLTATVSALGAVLFAPAAFAASTNIVAVSGATALMMAPEASMLLDTKGHFSPLSNFLIPSVGHDAAASRPNAIAADLSQGIKLELANGRNWEGYGDLFPSAWGLSSGNLSGTTAYAGVTFELTDSLDLSFGRSELGFGALSSDQASPFSRDLAQRLGDNLRDTGTTSATHQLEFCRLGRPRNHRVAIERQRLTPGRDFRRRCRYRRFAVARHLGARRLRRRLGDLDCL